MTSNVTYTVLLVPENADKIDAINRILLGDSVKEPATQKLTESPAETSTESAKSVLTLDQVKRAAKKSKSAHGEDFTNSVLAFFDVPEASSLARRMSAIDEQDYEAIIANWEAGPRKDQADESEDDLDDELGDDSEVTAEAVKTALKAYAKDVGRDEAKEIMTKHGASALSKVGDCTPAQLKSMFAELV